MATMWFMSKSRRHFLNTSLGLMGAAAACSRKQPKTGEPPAGAPPAFGTAPAVGPQVSPSTFAEAEKLVQFELTPAERSQAAGNWRNSLAPLGTPQGRAGIFGRAVVRLRSGSRATGGARSRPVHSLE